MPVGVPGAKRPKCDVHDRSSLCPPCAAELDVVDTALRFGAGEQDSRIASGICRPRAV